MTLNQLVSKIAKREGKKSQVKVGDVREIVGIIADEIYNAPENDVLFLLVQYGRKRNTKKENPKK